MTTLAIGTVIGSAVRLVGLGRAVVGVLEECGTGIDGSVVPSPVAVLGVGFLVVAGGERQAGNRDERGAGDGES